MHLQLVKANSMDHYPLSGSYCSGQFVIVEGKKFQEELSLLGCYGIDLDTANRKEISRRGPSDQAITNLELPSAGETTVLTLHEAFFLAYALGCLSISSESSQKLSLLDCWNLFSEYYKQSINHIEFAIEYGVYHYFRTRGWIVKSGENYGTNFLLYKLGPACDHAQYAVLIVSEDDSTALNYKWESLLTFHRVVQSVNKELLLVYVECQDKVFARPESIERIRISCKIFTSISNTLNKSVL